MTWFLVFMRLKRNFFFTVLPIPFLTFIIIFHVCLDLYFLSWYGIKAECSNHYLGANKSPVPSLFCYTFPCGLKQTSHLWPPHLQFGDNSVVRFPEVMFVKHCRNANYYSKLKSSKHLSSWHYSLNYFMFLSQHFLQLCTIFLHSWLEF